MTVDLRLAATTAAGEAFVARCEKHAEDFATRAAAHDRTGEFPVENMNALVEDGVTAAPLPPEHGGMGLASVTDLAAGISRLARGDAATSLAVTMHLGPCWSMSRSHRQALLRGDTVAAERLSLLLDQIGREGCMLCGAGTEPGTHTRFPQTEARRVDGGWLVSGTKIFVTNSPVATIFNVFCRVRGEDGGWQSGRALIHRESSGLQLVENWDGLGMRATGSHTLKLTDVFVPDMLMTARGEWGAWSVPELVHSSAGNLAQIATYVGIAEEARDLVRGVVTTRRKAPSGRLLSERHAIQTNFARIEIAVATARAALERTGRAWDDLLRRGDDDIALSEAHDLMAEYQITKQIVERNCIE